MPTSASVVLVPLSTTAITSVVTDGGTIVEMTTVPHRIHHPDGFRRFVTVTRWRRGPMHPDDAAALVRIALSLGTPSKAWTPILTTGDDPSDERTPPRPSNGPDGDDAQGDFGDLLL